MGTKYKLIKTYPGSPKLGEVKYATDSIFYKDKPRGYPEYWEKLENLPTCTDEVGRSVELYDKVWIIEDGTIVEVTLTPEVAEGIFFFSYGDAYSFLDDNIAIMTMEGPVTGDVPLYGILPKAQWQTVETTSGYLYSRELKHPDSESPWIYFKSRESRTSYIEIYKPKYSLDQIQQLIWVHCNSYPSVQELKEWLKSNKTV